LLADAGLDRDPVVWRRGIVRRNTRRRTSGEDAMPTIRVMTFNVQGAQHPAEEPNRWEQRAALNLRTIEQAAPDLLGLQEVQHENLATYRAHLRGYSHVVGNNYGDTPPTEWTSILWREARFALVAVGEFWLSRTPNEPSVDWGVPYRGATWVHLRDRTDGAGLLALNTHFEDGPDGEQSRVEGSRLIVERVTALQAGRLPAIVLGDFNCNPDLAAARVFSAAGFTDSYLAIGNRDGEVSTYHGFAGSAYDPTR
jgi:endonuclease/exonuclease/phosphatase family metal-dependent hydrolase